MAANALVQTRIDGKIKEQAATALAAMGLTVSDAVRLMLTRVAHDKALPFELFRPNAETIAAMEEARRGGGKRYDSFQALLADLDDEEDRADGPVQAGPETRAERALRKDDRSGAGPARSATHDGRSS